MHPIAYCVASDETKEGFSFFIKRVSRALRDRCGQELRPECVVSDCSQELRKAVRSKLKSAVNFLCRNQYQTLIKGFLRDDVFFPLISSKETRDERDKRLSGLRNLLFNLSFCGDSKLFDWLWSTIKETLLRDRKEFVELFEAEFVQGPNVSPYSP